MRKRGRPRTKYERRWLQAGGCVACERPRAKRTLRGGPSKRVCPKHLAANRRHAEKSRGTDR